MKTVISTSEAPIAVGPYSKGIAPGQFVFCSGQIPLEPETGPFTEGDISHQTPRMLKNIETLVRAYGVGMEQAVKRTVSFTDLSNFVEMNMADAMYFPSDPPCSLNNPGRSSAEGC